MTKFNPIHLYSGKPFSIHEPDPEKIEILDIAHSLSNQCRYNGHTKTFYSVAEHSVLVADMVARRTDDKEIIKQAFMHDASEAYVGDVVRPLKDHLPEFESFETPVWEAVCKRFELDSKMNKLVHEMDYAACSIEKRDLMNPNKESFWGDLPEPDPYFKVTGLSPKEAKMAFLIKFSELFGLKRWFREWMQDGYPMERMYFDWIKWEPKPMEGKYGHQFRD